MTMKQNTGFYIERISGFAGWAILFINTVISGYKIIKGVNTERKNEINRNLQRALNIQTI